MTITETFAESRQVHTEKGLYLSDHLSAANISSLNQIKAAMYQVCAYKSLFFSNGPKHIRIISFLYSDGILP